MELEVGKVYSFSDIAEMAYNPYRGILIPTTKDYIILISSVDGLYQDRWDDANRIFRYTGEGQVGNQSVDKGGNKAIRDHVKNGKSLYVFEKPKKNEYIFMGEFKFSDYEYESQPDSKGESRSVVVFDLVLRDDFAMPIRKTKEEETKEIDKELKAKKLKQKDPTKFANRANLGTVKPGRKEFTIEKIDRDQYVKVAVKERAKGYCELCGMESPFIKNDGTPYLEVHHVITLKENGPDTVYNTIALCPNCHRKIHYANDNLKEEEKSRIMNIIVENLLEDDDLLFKAKELFDK